MPRDGLGHDGAEALDPLRLCQRQTVELLAQFTAPGALLLAQRLLDPPTQAVERGVGFSQQQDDEQDKNGRNGDQQQDQQEIGIGHAVSVPATPGGMTSI